MVSAGGITFCDEDGNGVIVQRHVGVLRMKATLEDGISVLNKGFTRGHNMTREEGWAVVSALLKEAEERVTEGMEMEKAKLREEGEERVMEGMEMEKAKLREEAEEKAKTGARPRVPDRTTLSSGGSWAASTYTKYFVSG